MTPTGGFGETIAACMSCRLRGCDRRLWHLGPLEPIVE
jgi:hypothetical protein